MQTRQDITARRAEVDAKLARLRERMRERHLELVVLTESANIAWITAGAATNVILNSDRSAVSVAVTMDQATVLANTVEAPRLEAEEHVGALGLTRTGSGLVGFWRHTGAPSSAAGRLEPTAAGWNQISSTSARTCRSFAPPSAPARSTGCASPPLAPLGQYTRPLGSSSLE